MINGGESIGEPSQPVVDVCAVMADVDAEIGHEIDEKEATNPGIIAPIKKQQEYAHGIALLYGQRLGLERLRQAIETEKAKRTQP